MERGAPDQRGGRGRRRPCRPGGASNLLVLFSRCGLRGSGERTRPDDSTVIGPVRGGRPHTPEAQPRMLVVSNRLPVTLAPLGPGKWARQPGSGGLVTALEPVLRERGGIW